MRLNPPVLRGSLPARMAPSTCKACGRTIEAGDPYWQAKLPYRAHFGEVPDRFCRDCPPVRRGRKQ